MNCQQCGEEMTKRFGEQSSLFAKRKYCSQKCSGLASRGRPSWNRGKPMERWKGEKNPNWKGGISPVNLAIRGSLEYKNWRREVFERDDYTCQFCGKRGVKLHADHIKPFAYYPKLRFSLSNGRTLCKPCHVMTDTYKQKITAQV